MTFLWILDLKPFAYGIGSSRFDTAPWAEIEVVLYPYVYV